MFSNIFRLAQVIFNNNEKGYSKARKRMDYFFAASGFLSTT